MIEQIMILEDELFEDIKKLSDEADALGLVDVAVVLEFAMDVFLRETGAVTGAVTETAAPESDPDPRKSRREADFDKRYGALTANLPVAVGQRYAS